MKKVYHCPVERALSLFERKWNAKVIYALTSADAKRFSELKRDIPDISNMMLTSTLRELEERGIVKREQFNEIPPHVEYSLTEGGRAMKPIFQRMGEWSAKYLPSAIDAPSDT